MKNVAIIYWSGTGNTEAMANNAFEGAKSAGANAEIFTCSEFNVANAENFDAFALGCPAMGSEELEDSEFEPLYQALKPKLAGKKVALFGSYGWGGGEWMNAWESDCFSGAPIKACDSVITEDSPNEAVLKKCEELGSALAK